MPKRRPGPKVLLVGDTGFSGVTCVDWLATELPNVADFDIVFVNSVTLTELIERANEGPGLIEEDIKLLKHNLSSVEVGLAKVLRSHGSVYGIVCPRVGLRVEGYYHPPSNSDWLPLPVELTAEPGNTLRHADLDEGILKAFERYLDQVASWGCVFSRKFSPRSLEEAVEEHAHDLGKNLRGQWSDAAADMTSAPIATDRQGNSVAELVRYRLFAPESRGYDGKVHHEADPTFESGSLVVLVPPTEVASQEGLRILLEDLLGIGIRSVPPSWVQVMKMPSDDDLTAKISAAEAQVQQCQATLQVLLVKRREKDRFKAILYEDGPPLQEACQKTFEAMGITTRPSPVSDEFMIELEGQWALVEVSGSKKSVSQRDVSQLFKDMGKYFAETGQPIKGLFVGNPWRNIPPEERDTKDQPMFPDNVAQFARDQRIALLSTVVLFEAHCAYLEGTLDSKTIFTRLMEGEGVVRLADPPTVS